MTTRVKIQNIEGPADITLYREDAELITLKPGESTEQHVWFGSVIHIVETYAGINKNNDATREHT